jgi:iron complex transport system substrate-binding protein
MVAAALAAAVVCVTTAAAPAVVQNYPVRVRDAMGATTTIAAAPRRIVSLAPSVTEILFALGLDGQIVGISDADDYPPDRLAGRERIGGVIVNIEKIVALRPDLVVGLASLQRDQILRLQAIRLPVLAVDSASLIETTGLIRMLGRVTGRGRQAEGLALSIEGRARTVRRSRPVRVYAEVWYEPILAAGRGTLIHDLVRRAGGQNIFGDRQGYGQVPLETVLVRNPQVIFLLYQGRHRLLAQPVWRATDAGRRGRVHELPPELVTRPGPRLADGLAMISRILLSEH